MTQPNGMPPEYSQGQSLADRLSMLQQQQPWMEDREAVTLAVSDTSDNELLGIADGLRQQVRQTWDGISHFFDDPVLDQTPKALPALRRYVLGTIGPVPVADNDLMSIQQNLLNRYRDEAGDLQVTGVWDAGWQQLLQRHARQEFQDKQAGAQPGSVTAGGFVHGLIRSLNPSGIASGVVGFAKSLPEDFRQMASDAGGAFAQLGDGVVSLAHPEDLFKRGGEVGERTRQARAKGQSTVNQALGGDLTQKEAFDRAGSGEDFAGLINDIGTLFLLSGAGSAAKGAKAALAKGGSEGFLKRSTTDEALRSGGIVAKSLRAGGRGTQIGGGALLGGVSGGVAAGATGNDVTQGIVGGALLGGIGGGVMPKRAFSNIPLLKNTGPVVEQLADANGLYFRARTRLAQPYNYGAVRAAGSVTAQAQAFSLKAHGVGALQGLFGDDAGIIQQAIETTNPLDPIDQALNNRLSFTAAGVHFAPDLDYLMFFLHGPMGALGTEGSVTGALAQSARASTDGYNAALQNVGAIGQVEQATGRSFNQLVEMAGGRADKVHDWIGNKVRQHAAYQSAEEALDRIKYNAPEKFATLTPDDRADFLLEHAGAVLRDPEALTAATGRMLGSGNYLRRNIQNEIRRSATKPSAHLKHELNDFIDAGSALTHGVLPYANTDLLVARRAPELLIDRAEQGLLGAEPRLATGEVDVGSLGVARKHTLADGAEDFEKSTLTSQRAALDHKAFRKELELAKTPEARLGVGKKMRDYLFDNYGLDARKLQVFENNPEELLSVVQGRISRLASEVYLGPNAPQELIDAWAAIDKAGYRVVSGTDIGHTFRSDLPPLPDLGVPISRARKVATALGLNGQHFSHLDFGADRRLRVTQSLQNEVDQGRIVLPPTHGARRS